jgi:hypothetical protein
MPANPSIVFAHGLSHPDFVLDVIRNAAKAV